MAIKPILFNTEMVRANLDGKKSCTRRIVKPQPTNEIQCPLGICTDGDKSEIGKFAFGSHEGGGKMIFCKPPYQPEDILYVRETWNKGLERYMYRADYSDTEKFYQGGKEMVPIHSYAEGSRTHLVKVYGCEGGAVAGDYRIRSKGRGNTRLYERWKSL